MLTDTNPLGQRLMDLVLELENNASRFLLAAMGSRGKSEIKQRIFCNRNQRQLVDVACRAYPQKVVRHQGDNSEYDPVSPKEVGSNIYLFLCHQLLAQHNKDGTKTNSTITPTTRPRSILSTTTGRWSRSCSPFLWCASTWRATPKWRTTCLKRWSARRNCGTKSLFVLGQHKHVRLGQRPLQLGRHY